MKHGTEIPPVPPQEFRLYEENECGRDGYPAAWHEGLKRRVRELVSNRCVRCHHPYECGAHGSGEWTPCDDLCRHGGPVKFWTVKTGWGEYDGPDETIAQEVLARWRILTVHHLDGDKRNCRWWNLAALCQRCHLTIQGRVHLHRVWPWEHSEWFKPYAAGWYAFAYLGEDLSREEVEARMDELLALERVA
jgi:hypothetical protein